MFLPAMFVFAMHQDAATIQFQPKVGEKFRFAMTMENEAGKSELPEGAKAYAIFKVAGVKDGKFTVFQTLEVVPFGAPVESALYGSYKLDSLMNTEIVETSEPLAPEGNGEAASTIMNGCFGLIYSPSPVKLKEAWKAPIDLVSMIKKYLPAVPPESKPQYEGNSERLFKLELMDEKTATIRSQIDCTVNISGEDSSGKRQIHMEQKCDQVTTIDRSSGVPIKLERKYKLSIASGANKNSIGGTIKLVREK